MHKNCKKKKKAGGLNYFLCTSHKVCTFNLSCNGFTTDTSPVNKSKSKKKGNNCCQNLSWARNGSGCRKVDLKENE